MSRPYFLWDYDLTESDVHHLLKFGSDATKTWLIGRILSSAKYEDVWKYINLPDLVNIFPKIRMRRSLRDMWSLCLNTWGYEIQSNQQPYS